MLDDIGTVDNAETVGEGRRRARQADHGLRSPRLQSRGPARGVLPRHVDRARSERVDLAKVVEATVLEELRASKPGRALYTNVEFWSAVVLEHAGIPRPLFTPTFCVSRTIGLDGAHPRAGPRQPVDPSDGGLHRADGQDALTRAYALRRSVAALRRAGADATSGRMHRACTCARVLAQRRLRAVDLVQRVARPLEPLRATCAANVRNAPTRRGTTPRRRTARRRRGGTAIRRMNSPARMLPTTTRPQSCDVNASAQRTRRRMRRSQTTVTLTADETVPEGLDKAAPESRAERSPAGAASVRGTRDASSGRRKTTSSSAWPLARREEGDPSDLRDLRHAQARIPVDARRAADPARHASTKPRSS